nr:hypothetical protein Iba_chr10aCG16750 [Ipomoea batatas]
MGFTFIFNFNYCFLPSFIYSSFSLANFPLQTTGYRLRGPNVGRQSGATTSRHTLCLITVKAEAEVVPLCWSFLNPILNSIAMPISVSKILLTKKR